MRGRLFKKQSRAPKSEGTLFRKKVTTHFLLITQTNAQRYDETKCTLFYSSVPFGQKNILMLKVKRCGKQIIPHLFGFVYIYVLCVFLFFFVFSPYCNIVKYCINHRYNQQCKKCTNRKTAHKHNRQRLHHCSTAGA